MIKSKTFNTKKGTRISEIFTKEGAKITIVWGFVMDEERRNECEDYLNLIHEVEAEREEIKYYNNKIRLKLLKVKEKSRNCKVKLQKLMLSMEPILEVYQDKKKLYNDRALIITERKRIDSHASEMLYLKVRIQKELEKLSALNSYNAG